MPFVREPLAGEKKQFNWTEVKYCSKRCREKKPSLQQLNESLAAMS